MIRSEPCCLVNIWRFSLPTKRERWSRSSGNGEAAAATGLLAVQSKVACCRIRVKCQRVRSLRFERNNRWSESRWLKASSKLGHKADRLKRGTSVAPAAGTGEA